MPRIALLASLGVAAAAAESIIGGWGEFQYEYLPDRLQPPAGADMVNCHGLVTDAAGNILLTYENPNNASDAHCLIRWAPDGTGAEFLDGGGAALCAGTPHGLAIVAEGGGEFLYHANNEQKLTKTTLDGTIVWQVDGNFGQNASDDYRPTWFAAPPGGSELAYLCDGYGSNKVYVFNRTDGRYTGRSYGGAGGRDQHGAFSTNHGCTYDARSGEVAVADRANSRLEFFGYDDADPDVFDYRHASGECSSPRRAL